MRKATLTMIIFLITGMTALQAQSNGMHALGLRFGGGDGVGSEISYQQFIGGPNRLEFDLGIYDDGWNDGFKLTVLSKWEELAQFSPSTDVTEVVGGLVAFPSKISGINSVGGRR